MTDLLTTAEAAEVLGIEPGTVTHWARKLKLGRRLVPGRRTPLLFGPADLDALRDRPRPGDHRRLPDPSPAALYRRAYRAKQRGEGTDAE